MDKKKLIFDVICNDEDHLNNILNWYNSMYETDFKMVDFIYDEVTFARIEASDYSIPDIFNIGYAFGTEEQKLRSEGKIDW